EAIPPPDLPAFEYESDLDTPAAPVEYAQVEYPDTTRELRIRFTGVTGGTIAEATRRTLTGGNPNPWASMTEAQWGANWYAWAAVDYEGLDADFRVRFFNSAEEGSYWSDLLSASPVTIVNTPVAIAGDPDAGLYTTAMHVAYYQHERRNPGLPPYTWTLLAEGNARPENVFEIDAPAPPPGQTVTYRVIAYTSDDTPSAPYEWTLTTPPITP